MAHRIFFHVIISVCQSVYRNKTSLKVGNNNNFEIEKNNKEIKIIIFIIIINAKWESSTYTIIIQDWKNAKSELEWEVCARFELGI